MDSQILSRPDKVSTSQPRYTHWQRGGGQRSNCLLASRQESALLLLLNFSLSPGGMVGTTKAVDRMAKKSTTQKLWKLTSSRKSPCAKNMRSCAFRFPLLCSNCSDANSSSVPSELVTLPYKHKIHGTNVRQIFGKPVNFHPVKPLARSCSARGIIIPDRITPEYQFIVVIAGEWLRWLPSAHPC